MGTGSDGTGTPGVGTVTPATSGVDTDPSCAAPTAPTAPTRSSSTSATSRGVQAASIRTRIETEALAALAWRGLDRSQIIELYPATEDADVADALDLERQLQPDLAPVA